MYYSNQQFNMNVNQNFNNNNNNNYDNNPPVKKNKSNKKFFIIGLIGIIIIVGIWMLIKFNSSKSYLILDGTTDIVLYQNSKYVEYGYKAYDDEGTDLSNEVVIKNPVNTSVIGEYVVTYKLGKVVKTRTITIVPRNNHLTYIILNGPGTIYLKVGDTYQEPGYQILDTESHISSDQVTVTGNIKTDKAGTYKLIYSFKRTDGITVSEESVVIVTEANINLSYTPTNITNKNVAININITDNYFDYLLLPDGNKAYKRDFTYTVNENGSYNFIVYSKDGSNKKANITISNIDKTAPKISFCSGKIDNNVTTYTIYTNDNDIEKFVYNNQYETTDTTYTINTSLPNATVTVYDYAGNSNQTTCESVFIQDTDDEKPSSSSSNSLYPSSSSSSSKPSSSASSSSSKKSSSSSSSSSKPSSSKPSSSSSTIEQPIDPKGNEKIVKQTSTDTLKVWIEKISRSGRTNYYVAHVWAKNPYNQLKSGVPNNFGNELLTPSNILTQTIKKNNYQNKLVVAINGSGFVLKDTYDVTFYEANKNWNMTSVSPIVIVEGNVLRDFTSGKFPDAKNHVTYGLKKDGNLAYYTYTYNTTNNQKNINSGKQIINDGVINTWAFRPVLVTNGKAVSGLSNTQNIRNALCQINKNNFVLITDSYDSNRSGFSYSELANVMVNLGCKTGFNLDGGGSVAMLYKDKSSQDISVITGNNRRVADILYFHE